MWWTESYLMGSTFLWTCVDLLVITWYVHVSCVSSSQLFTSDVSGLYLGTIYTGVLVCSSVMTTFSWSSTWWHGVCIVFIENNRMDVFACSPAPVQVTWIAYPNTTVTDINTCTLSHLFGRSVQWFATDSEDTNDWHVLCENSWKRIKSSDFMHGRVWSICITEWRMRVLTQLVPRSLLRSYQSLYLWPSVMLPIDSVSLSKYWRFWFSVSCGPRRSSHDCPRPSCVSLHTARHRLLVVSMNTQKSSEFSMIQYVDCETMFERVG